MIGTISGEKFPESLNKFGGNLLVNKTVRGLRCWVWVSLVQRKPSAISRKYITRNGRTNADFLIALMDRYEGLTGETAKEMHSVEVQANSTESIYELYAQ